MQAQPGDELTVRRRHQGDDDRHGQIIEVQGLNGAPPYRVRWVNGYESLFFPSPGTVVERHTAPRRTAKT